MENAKMCKMYFIVMLFYSFDDLSIFMISQI